MTDYKERFKREYSELKERQEKLHAMLLKLDAGTLDFVPDCPRSLLTEQDCLMRQYLLVLRVRAGIEQINLGGEVK